jgi:DNA-binding HxlR family transcriptional regulator
MELAQGSESTVSTFNGPGFLADCEALLATEIFASKWAIVILFALSSGPKRPMDLVTLSGGVSRKVLTQTLRRLDEQGLVCRESYSDSPRRVEYSLTPLGLTLQAPIGVLTDWARQYGGAVEEARERRSAN